MIRYIVACLGIALLSLATLSPLPTAAAEATSSSPQVERISGSDEFAVAAAAAKNFPSGQPVAFVVSVDAHPDAMVAATRAAGINAPVLLVNTRSVPAATREALTRLSPQRIVVVGGDGVVSDGVLTDLRGYASTGSVQRVSGLNRYVTAAELAQKFDRGTRRVYLAGGHGYADAMTGAALAGYQGSPMALTPKDRLHPATASALRHLRPQEIVILGGSGVVSSAVAKKLSAYATTGKVTRIAGVDRYATAAKIADKFPASSSHAYVALGTSYSEALSAAAAAGKAHAPLLLLRSSSVPKATHTSLGRKALDTIHAVGTRASIPDAVIRELMGGTTPPSPPPTDEPLLGGYLGGPMERPDERFRESFGAWPDLASTYYQAQGRGGGKINRAYEQARIDRGTIPVITVTPVNGPYSMKEIGSGAADGWIDYWARELGNLRGEVWFTLDHEFEVKLNQGKYPSSTTPLDYARAFNRFQARVKAKAPNVKFLYWYGHHDREKIDAVGSRIDRPDVIALDPYVFDHHSGRTTFEQMAQPKLDWLRSRSWYDGQPIILGEFAKDTGHGEQNVEDFLTKLRPRMEALGLSGALYFSRNKSGDILADLTTSAFPDARRAFGASVRN
ncbi:hypothetical protein BJF86_02290 [Serinicoccus sp. CNJ-927]|uniref:cell wall-binding repeat-containing protein n=1 Tax=Serinicoccus sp. CNJ-927 TaxID=1904970 RepID=UPI000967E90B|nr:cell wall-binding repeat-containing protein [Serinicoccus sp. CNJ-927]OLT41859.1 hypothetical protein BJF86_02290 [Serinicoccus sp. CNJ-927]